MQRLLGFLLLVSLACLAAGGAPRARAQTRPAGVTRKYPVGWNLVAAPPGTSFPLTSPLLTAQPGDVDYEQVQPGQDTASGFGYWAYLAGSDPSGYSKPVVLTPGSGAPYSVSVPAGQWILIGNPSGLLLAGVQGADTSLSFDPLHGYEPADVLQPGQGAWVASAAGGVVTVTPLVPAAQPSAGGLQAGASVSVTVSTGPAVVSSPIEVNPAIPDPRTAYEPVATWWLGPYPILPGAPRLPWRISPPLSNWPICPGYVVTPFALNFCGSLAGEPVPGNGVPNPFIVP